jgi:glycerate kinase
MAVRVVVAPDKFKGAMTASEAAQAIARGFARAGRSCVTCPMADGGEGTVDAFLAGGAQRRSVHAHGPLGDPVDAAYAVQGDLAIVELAAASGLSLVPAAKRDVMRADTYGTGEVLLAALDAGARRIIAGIGGSATNDVGTGLLRALGVRFVDRSGVAIEGPMPAYRALETIDLAALDPRTAGVQIEVASDVDNPLTGPQGAARTYAAQKGASEKEIAELDAIAAHVADVAAATLHADLRDAPGAGAAGGAGFALLAFLRARMERGVELIARERGLPELLADAALCATGEGKIDMQTLHGKAVDGVASMAHERGVPVVAFGGLVEADARAALERRGIDVRQTAPDGMPQERAMREAAELLERAAYEYAVERR